MLAPLSRLTLIVAAALLISFIDGTFDVGDPTAEPVDAPTLLLALSDVEAQADSSGLSIDRIGQRMAGTDLVHLRARVDAPALNCKLTVVYESGEADVLDDVVSDADGLCVTAFDVSDDESAVGVAQVTLEVVDDLGRLEGGATRAFTVK